MELRPRFKACEDIGSGTSEAERESIGTLGVRSGITRGVASLGDVPGHHSLWIRAGYRPLLSRDLTTQISILQCPGQLQQQWDTPDADSAEVQRFCYGAKSM